MRKPLTLLAQGHQGLGFTVGFLWISAKSLDLIYAIKSQTVFDISVNIDVSIV